MFSHYSNRYAFADIIALGIVIWTVKGLFRYKDFFEKKHNQPVKKRDGSTKKVQFKDDVHEMELDGSENDDGNVGPTLDLLVLVEPCTYTSLSMFSFSTGRPGSLNPWKGAAEDAC